MRNVFNRLSESRRGPRRHEELWRTFDDPRFFRVASPLFVTRSCGKIHLFAHDTKYTILPTVQPKLALSVSFFVRKVNFPALVGKILSVRKIETNLKCYRTIAGNSTFRMQNDTDSTNFRYKANKKYRLYHVRNVF